MPLARVSLDKQGIERLLTSDAVQRDLDARAARVAQTAASQGIRVGGIPGDIALPVEAISDGNDERAAAVVAVNHPAGLAVEAKHRLLVSSLDAAR